VTELQEHTDDRHWSQWIVIEKAEVLDRKRETGGALPPPSWGHPYLQVCFQV